MTTRTTANGTHDITESNRLDNIKDSVKGLVEKGQEKATAIKDKAVDLQHRAKEKGGAALDRATGAIKDHPLAAVGVAFGIGYVLMRLVRR